MRRTVFAVVAVAAALGLGACGDSPEDEAREDGEQIGESLRSLADADTKTDIEQGIKEIQVTIENMGEDTREHVQDQIETQRDTLQDAVGGTKEELQSALQEIRAQADAFRNGANSVANEFWRGVEDGYDDDE